ncbi:MULTISPECIES: recombination regulator RecX [Streptomyces]|uniref:Regulatory protein RecX n=1 Tax=Streptomyces chartreusis NRRL 3882 TaxID=1079985 RepID=A0A2N9B5M0_STRCX|nr:recombination regulator RecX [Streptomyces chartreusis]MYS89845.1 recombination regulator RecX [Streptomyces sp. SID5464]SOR78631.1 Regulatory protein RecX [Streptomyces chartreusis NRRL 3882]
MTRRTDWAEYEYAASGAPRGRGTGGETGSAVDGEDGHDRLHRDDGLFGDDGSYGEASRGRGSSGSGSSGRGARGGGSSRDGAHDGGSPGGRGRGRRRRGFGAADTEDGDSLSSSRAEQGEPPGDPVEQARAICLRLLTGTPRTRKQLADALRKRQIPDDAAEEVLSRFEEVGLINDSAFAEAWVESRHHGRGLARRALARELRTKGVDSTLIDEAVSQLDSEQEETTARELVARKLRSTRGLDRDKRLRRLAGMLARKGYSEGMALRVVRQALEEEGEDTEFLGDEVI